MTPEKISNLLNIICQAHPDINFYHYGYESDININIKNNFTGDNSRGKKYPSLLFEFPSESWTLERSGAAAVMRGLLVFNDTQYYNSEDGSNNSRSILEIQTALQKTALEVVLEFNRLGRTFGGREVIGITAVNNVIYAANLRADRLIEVVLDVSINYFLECSSFVADIGALDPPFNVLPPEAGDYELK